uniref:Uncharacterized protein MANES_13G008000 n=1 Tax=Rhizophora mucronata TaxID=61149 RepID=A0A2P2PRC8_RHIMU
MKNLYSRSPSPLCTKHGSSLLFWVVHHHTVQKQSSQQASPLDLQYLHQNTL